MLPGISQVRIVPVPLELKDCAVPFSRRALKETMARPGTSGSAVTVREGGASMMLPPGCAIMTMPHS
ncbi:MAG: hypothetical protein A4E28_02794 [Methanocella sp. PtaU1.Bin125]|nr:MAG: hypothetical protein A4E28_02794 [Methanocella sp. PtaU1.Bin125]